MQYGLVGRHLRYLYLIENSHSIQWTTKIEMNRNNLGIRQQNKYLILIREKY